MPEDVVEGAPDLEEAREQVSGLLPAGQRRAGQVEEVLAVGTELLVERDPPAGIARVGGLHDEVEQVVLVAGVEEVEDDVLVQPAIRCGGLGAGGEALAKRCGEGGRPLAQPGDVRVLHRAVGAHAPYPVGVDERGPEGRALGLDALGEEGIRVPQAGERRPQRPLFPAHEAHVHGLGTGWSAGVQTRGGQATGQAGQVLD